MVVFSSCLIRLKLLSKIKILLFITLLSVLLAEVKAEVKLEWRPTHAALDMNQDCSFWASNGECDRNRKYMSYYCTASCKKYAGGMQRNKNKNRMMNDPNIINRIIVAVDSYGRLPESLVSVIDNVLDYINTTFEPYLERSVFLVPVWIYDYSPTQVVAFDLLILAIIFSIIFLCLPYGQLRHLHCGISGLFLGQYIGRHFWLHSFVTSVIVYFLFFLLPKNRKLYTTVIPTILFIHLFALHFYAMYDNYGRSMPLMVAFQMSITPKLWSLAYNLYDGQILNNNKNNGDEISFATKKCSKFAIKDIPSFVEYFGYCFNFATFLGPPFEFSVYKQTCDGTIFYKKRKKETAKCENKDTDSNTDEFVRVLPNNIWHVVKPLAQTCLLQLLMTELSKNRYTIDMLVDDSVLSLPFLQRMKHLFISLVHGRCIFYLSWKAAEFLCNLCYFGFEGYDETGEVIGWENAVSIRIYSMEFAKSPTEGTKNWNVVTGNWIKRYVYFRHNFSVVAAYTVNCVWHGFYPSYMLLAINVIFYTLAYRLMMKKVITPYITPIIDNISESKVMQAGNDDLQKTKKRLFGMFLDFVPNALFLFVVQSTLPIALYQRIDLTLVYWRSYYFYPILIPVLATLILSMLPTPREKAAEKYKAE